MWTILETGDVAKILAAAQPQIRKKYQVWKSIVEADGPGKLRSIPGFHDEALAGKLAGKRSSRLNIHCRLIYEVYQDQVTVSVVAIDQQHSYRAKESAMREREVLYRTRSYATLTPAESLRYVREFSEISQKDLSELSGIPQPAISAMESGRAPIGAERAARLARALHVHPAVILFPNWSDERD